MKELRCLVMLTPTPPGTSSAPAKTRARKPRVPAPLLARFGARAGSGRRGTGRDCPPAQVCCKPLTKAPEIQVGQRARAGLHSRRLLSPCPSLGEYGGRTHARAVRKAGSRRAGRWACGLFCRLLGAPPRRAEDFNACCQPALVLSEQVRALGSVLCCLEARPEVSYRSCLLRLDSRL